jgi:hypothetical protein
VVKSEIVAAILEKLREEFDSRRAVSKLTRSAGNDTESKAESKYDTLSIEENYLADGLARQAQIAATAAAAYENFELRDFGPDDAINLGALVELEFPDGREWFFLGPSGGGIEIPFDGKIITVLTPESPLGGQLIGCRRGDTTNAPKTTIRTTR